MDQIIFNSTLNGVLQAFFALLVLVVVVHAAVVISRAIRVGQLPTTEEPAVPSRIVEPAGLLPTAEEKRAMAEHERLVGAGAGRPEAEEQ
jgi:carbon starvation protein